MFSVDEDVYEQLEWNGEFYGLPLKCGKYGDFD
jgi:hypothetical protein